MHHIHMFRNQRYLHINESIFNSFYLFIEFCVFFNLIIVPKYELSVLNLNLKSLIFNSQIGTESNLQEFIFLCNYPQIYCLYISFHEEELMKSKNNVLFYFPFFLTSLCSLCFFLFSLCFLFLLQILYLKRNELNKLLYFLFFFYVGIFSGLGKAQS